MSTTREQCEVINPDGTIELVVIEHPIEGRVTRTKETLNGAGRYVSEVIPIKVIKDSAWTVIDNGYPVPREEWDTHMLFPGHQITCSYRVRGALGKVIAGGILLAAGMALMIVTPGNPFGAMVFMTGVALLFGGITEMMVGATAPPMMLPADEGLTYGFGGVQNSLRHGAPIAVLYGQQLIGGQVISVYTRTDNDSDVLYMLLGISEGEIAAITDIKINQQAYTSYRGVTTEVRLGLNNQPPMELFGNEIITPITVGQTVTHDALGTAKYTTTGSDLEVIEVIFNFPQGLFSVNTESGGFANASVTLEVEYRMILPSVGPWTTVFTNAALSPGLTAPTIATFLVTLPWPAPRAPLINDVVHYKVTFLTRHGETMPSASSTSVFVPVGHAIHVTAIPLGDSTVIGRRIYRHTNAATRFGFPPRYQMVAQINDNTTTAFDDYANPSYTFVSEIPIIDTSLGVGAVSPATITAGRRSVLRRTARIDNAGVGLNPGRYELRWRRTTVQSESSTLVDQVVVAQVNEILAERFAYPNVALVAIKALATDQLSGMPNVTCVAHGRLVKKFTTVNSYTVEYTRTPPWHCFDLLTNERFGGGRRICATVYNTGTLTVTNGSPIITLSGGSFTAKARRGMKVHLTTRLEFWTIFEVDSATQITLTQNYTGTTGSGLAFEIKLDDIDIQSFIDWAEFCEEMVPDDVGGEQPRCVNDLYLDADTTNLWDNVQKIAGIGQAAIIKMGNYIRAKPERATTSTQLFSMGNIVKDSFSEQFLPLKERANIFEVQYLDERKDYEQGIAVWEDPALFTNSDDPRRQTINMYGITRAAHAQRASRFIRKANHLLTRTINFKVSPEAVASEPGDVIYFQHQIPAWGEGGLVLQTSTALNTVVLDKSVQIVVSVVYQVIVRLANDTVETRTVNNSPGTTNILTVSSNFSSFPAAGDVWAFGISGVAAKPFRILAISRTSDNFVQLSCLEYNADVYDDTAVPEQNITIYSTLSPLTGIPPDVEDLSVVQADGTYQAVWISFTKPSSPIYRSARLYRIYSDREDEYLGETFDTTHEVTGTLPGDSVEIVVTSVSVFGVESTRDTAPTATALISASNPPDVAAFSDYYADDIAWLTWDEVEWLLDVTYEIRLGAAWATAVVIAASVTDNQITALGDGTYWIAAKDTNGSYSLNPTSLSVVGSIAGNNVVAALEEHTVGWTGTVTPGAVVADYLGFGTVLLLETTTMFDDVTDVDVMDTFDFFGDGVQETGSYEIHSSRRIDLGTVKPARVTASFVALADSITADFDSIVDFDLETDMDGSYGAFVTVQPQIQTSDLAGVFGDWKNLIPAVYTGRIFNFRVLMTSSNPTITCIVEELTFSIDMPDVNDSGLNVAVAATTGTTIPFNLVFQAVPSVQITILDAAVGDYVDIPNASITPTQFHVYVRRSSDGAAIAKNINWFADGY